MRRLTVAIVGDGNIPAQGRREKIAEELGRLLVDHRYRILTGGRGGVMAAASRGGRGSSSWTDGDILAVIPGKDPAQANPWADIVIPTGIGEMRNALVAQSDVVVGIGGGAGTLSELALAWKYDRLVIGVAAGGWSQKLAGAPVDGRVRFPKIADDAVFQAETARDVLRIIQTRISSYMPDH